MSDKEILMKFESLPNEIVIECFEYLNGFEIFYSFDQLNNRLNTLIYNIPLHINFHDINKSMFDQFCKKVLINPQIKNQIYSFKISNKDQCFQGKKFLSFFPINKCLNLQKFELILSTQLSDHFSFFEVEDDPGSYLNMKFVDLPLNKLHTLSIPYINYSILDTYQMSSIIKLTISRCNLNTINSLLKICPLLKYLHINSMKSTYIYNINEYSSNDSYGIYLKELIIDEFNDEFKNLKIFLKQISNLKSLSILNSLDEEMIIASQWESLITTFLPYLKIFKFQFRQSLRRKDENILINQFKQFQTDFWQKQHHWYTEYVIQSKSALIYTLPYPSNTYSLEQSEIRYSNKLINNINIFINVKHLDIYPSIFTKSNSYYFPNLTSITLSSGRYESLLTTDYIEYLKEIVNQCNVKHLETTNHLIIKNPLDFLELLKQTPHLSSLIINSKSLQSCFKNDELCKYLNKMIKKLQVHDNHWKHIQINEFCQIFSNLEELKCSIDNENNLLILIENLPKLTILQASYQSDIDPEIKLKQLKKQIEKMDMIFDIEKNFIEADTDEVDSKDFYSVTIFIWINKNRV